MPAVMQIWPEVKIIITTINQFMKLFINIFGVEGSNSISSFTVDIKGPGNLRKLIQDLFRPPNKYPREKPNMMTLWMEHIM